MSDSSGQKEDAPIRTGLDSEKIRPSLSLPMTYRGLKTKVSKKDFKNYQQCRDLCNQECPDYEKRFKRPGIATVNAVWKLLMLDHTNGIDTIESESLLSADWLDPAEKLCLKQFAKQAFVIALDTFVTAARRNQSTSYNNLFDALCRAYSDHYYDSPASIVRDMTSKRVSDCRRDMLLNGVDINHIWDFIVNKRCEKYGVWQNPLFKIRFPGAREAKTVELTEDNEILEEFLDLLNKDCRYRRSETLGKKILGPDTKANSHIPDRFEVCEDQKYNEIILGQNSKHLLRIQSESRLFLNVTAFNKDYEEAEQVARDRRDQLKKYWVDPSLPTTRRQNRKKWSRRVEHLTYMAIAYGLRHTPFNSDIEEKAREELKDSKAREKYERRYSLYEELRKEHGSCDGKYPEPKSLDELVGAALFTNESSWRQSVQELLADYDRTKRHVDTYRATYDQVKGSTGYQKISSNFYRTVNRRYQPENFFPTYVTAKPQVTMFPDAMGDESQLIDEGYQEMHDESPDGAFGYEESDIPDAESHDDLNSYRFTWFKFPDHDGNPCDMVGKDISSSQTQIIAALMGIKDLENRSMAGASKSFKQYLAEKAWARNQDPDDSFCLKEGYDDSSDPRLQELVKTLWLRSVYGAQPSRIVLAQNHDPKTYGPGWGGNDKDAKKLPGYNNAKNFRDHLYKEFPQVKGFLDACHHVAEEAINKEGGVTFTDPFDRVQVGWHPVARVDRKKGFDGHNLTLSLAGEMETDSNKLNVGDWLFKVDPNYANELELGVFSKGLWQEFLKNGVDLKDKVTVGVEKKDMWKIICGNSKYLAKRSKDGIGINIHAAKWKKSFKPSTQDANGHYPVDENKLDNMVAPCLIHMLDAYYSSLVMRNIHRLGIRHFVGIHDAWLVPEKALINGKVESGIEILEKAREEADYEWYNGLEPVYERLKNYLSGEHWQSVQKAHNTWKERTNNHDIPRFKSHPVFQKAV